MNTCTKSTQTHIYQTSINYLFREVKLNQYINSNLKIYNDYQTLNLSLTASNDVIRALSHYIGKAIYEEKYEWLVAPGSIMIKEINMDNYNIIFNSDFIVNIYKDGEQYCIDNDELNIYIVKDSRDEAIEEFKAQFKFVWRNIVEDDDSNLYDDALELKKYLLDITRKKV